MLPTPSNHPLARSVLSETRKFNTFVLLSHQTRGQVPERMQSALQNVELEVFFRTGRDDAEATAKAVGEIDPLLVKHEAEDEAAARGHPTFFTIQEQREMQASAIQNQAKRAAFVKYGEGRVAPGALTLLPRSRGRSGSPGRGRGSLPLDLLPADSGGGSRHPPCRAHLRSGQTGSARQDRVNLSFCQPMLPAHLRRPLHAADHLLHRGQLELTTECSSSRHRNSSVWRRCYRHFGKVDFGAGSLLGVHSKPCWKFNKSLTGIYTPSKMQRIQ